MQNQVVPVVTLAFDLAGIDYGAMSEGHQASLRRAILTSIAADTGVKLSLIKVALSAGSVKVSVIIWRKSDYMATMLARSIGTSATLGLRILSYVSRLDDMPITAAEVTLGPMSAAGTKGPRCDWE